MTSPFSISSIVTCFNEESSIEGFLRAQAAILRETGHPFEILAVDDGSADRTFERLRDLQEAIPELRVVIDFRRNFGQAAAQNAAIQHARNDCFLFMDSDFQLDPAQIPELIARCGDGSDFVTGRRTRRADPPSRRALSWAANQILRRLVALPVSDIGCTFKLVRRELIVGCGFDKNREFSWVTVLRYARRIAEVDVRHRPREQGRSGWRLPALARFFFRAAFIHGRGGTLRLLCLVLAIGPSAAALTLLVGRAEGLPAVSAFTLLGVLLVGVLQLAAIAEKDPGGPLYLIREVREKRS